MLIRQDTAEARARAAELVLAAFEEACGHQRDASDVLNVAESTLIRWVKRLKLTPRITKIQQRAKKRGEYALGRPKKKAD